MELPTETHVKKACDTSVNEKSDMELSAKTQVTQARDTSVNEKSDTVAPHGDSEVSNFSKAVQDDEKSPWPAEKSRDVTHTIQETFRITRPSIVTTSGNCKPLLELPSTNLMTTNCSQMNTKKSVHVVPRNFPMVSGGSSGRWSGYRNKHSLIPCNSHNAILLPRPQSSLTNTGMSEAHIQRIPVLNNTQFQLPKNVTNESGSSLSFVPQITNSAIADNIYLQPSHPILKSTLCPADAANDKKPTLTVQTSEDVNLNSLGKNNNSRVRNTREDSKTIQNNESIVKDKQIYEEDSQNVNKLDNDLKGNANMDANGLSKQTLNCSEPLEQNIFIKETISPLVCQTDTLTSFVQNESCSQVSKTEDFQNESSGSNTIVSDSIRPYPSTSQKMTWQKDSVTDELKKHVSGDLPLTSILESEHTDMSERVKNDCDRIDTENAIYNNSEEGQLPVSDPLQQTINKETAVERSMATPRKRRKRPYRENKNPKFDASRDDEEEEKVKKSYVIKNKHAHTKQKGKESTAKHSRSTQPFPMTSKAYQDIESRYMGNDLICLTSFETVFEEKCDIINKVESEKLSKVKDHHLLKLSDKEREYLRNKCYLENNLAVDVRRRFEQQPVSKKENVVDDPLCKTGNNEADDDIDVIRKETNSLPWKASSKLSSGKNSSQVATNSESSTSVNVGSVGESENDKDGLVKLHQKYSEKQRQMNEQSFGQCKFTDSLKQPSLDSIPQEKQGVLENSKKEVFPPKQHIANYPSTSTKIYYVVNSNDVARIKKSTSCTKGVNDLKNIIPTVSPQSIVNTTETKHVTANTKFSQTSTNVKQSYITLTQQEPGTCSSKVVFCNTQLEHQQSLRLQNREINALKLSSNNSFQPMKYSNKFTVKKLLEAKRDDRKDINIESGKLDVKSKCTINIPVQLYGRSMCGTSVIGHSRETSVRPETSASSNINVDVPSDSCGTPASNSSTMPVYRQTYQNGIQMKTLHVNQPALIPISTNQKTVFESAPLFPLPVKSMKQDSISPHGVYASGIKHDLEVPSGSEKNKPVFIKIGNQTMIMKRNEDKTSSKRKTLPAPKPKRTIADDYKRKRRRSRDMSVQRRHQKSLRSNIKELLKESHIPVHKLVNTLDLVPVELLKRFTSTKLRQETPDREFYKPKELASMQHANEIHETNVVNRETDYVDKNRSKQKKWKLCNSPANMADVIQINKDLDGSVNYNITQVKVRYRRPVSMEGQRSDKHLSFPCRLNFSTDGVIEKMNVETLRQGLYLVQNVNGLETKLLKGKLNTSLVLYPPHIATVPNGSLAIAVGDISSEEQETQYRFQKEGNDIQTVLDRFLWPAAFQNIDHFMDERYSSITDSSMSPRCSSPMFYSEEMRDVFNIVEPKPCSSDSSDKGLHASRRFETSFAKLDLQSTRFSERATALKIKQNELFESCRKLKSEQTVKEVFKKKKIANNDASRTENTNNDFDAGVGILSQELDIFYGEEHRRAHSSSPEANDSNDGIVIVDMD